MLQLQLQAQQHQLLLLRLGMRPRTKLEHTTCPTRSLDTRAHPQIEYDVLVCSVGERPGTFGVPGVEQFCFFMKEVADTVALRQRIQEASEGAGSVCLGVRCGARLGHEQAHGAGGTRWRR